MLPPSCLVVRLQPSSAEHFVLGIALSCLQVLAIGARPTLLEVFESIQALSGVHLDEGIEDNNTFRALGKVAASGAVREWDAAPPCWSFGALRRPRLRSKEKPAGFDPDDPKTCKQTMLAFRTAVLLFLPVTGGSYVSCEQPGSSVMFQLHTFRRLSEAGCVLTMFCFCGFGSGFQKPPNGYATSRGWSLCEALASVSTEAGASLLRARSLVRVLLSSTNVANLQYLKFMEENPNPVNLFQLSQQVTLFHCARLWPRKQSSSQGGQSR